MQFPKRRVWKKIKAVGNVQNTNVCDILGCGETASWKMNLKCKRLLSYREERIRKINCNNTCFQGYWKLLVQSKRKIGETECTIV
jgi:hypothetical protein